MSSVFIATKVIIGYTALGYRVKVKSDTMYDILEFYLYTDTHIYIHIYTHSYVFACLIVTIRSKAVRCTSNFVLKTI